MKQKETRGFKSFLTCYGLLILPALWCLFIGIVIVIYLYKYYFCNWYFGEMILVYVFAVTFVSIILCAIGRKKKNVALSVIACIVAILSVILATDKEFGKEPLFIHCIMVLMIIGNLKHVFVKKTNTDEAVSSVDKSVGSSVETVQMVDEMEAAKPIVQVSASAMEAGGQQPEEMKPQAEQKDVAQSQEQTMSFMSDSPKMKASQSNDVNDYAFIADELRKFKELLDMGAISQEEFDAMKKQLLGL